MLKHTSKQLSLYSSLEDMLDHNHPLFQLSNKINWKTFDDAFGRIQEFASDTLNNDAA